MILRIREDIPTTPIELHVQSAGVSEEEQIFYTEDDDETEEQILQRKRDARHDPANQLPDLIRKIHYTQKRLSQTNNNSKIIVYKHYSNRTEQRCHLTTIAP